MGILDDYQLALEERYGWVVLSISAQEAVVQDGANAPVTLPAHIVQDIVQDVVNRPRIERAKVKLEAALLADVQAFEQATGLPVVGISHSSVVDAEGRQVTDGVGVQINPLV